MGSEGPYEGHSPSSIPDCIDTHPSTRAKEKEPSVSRSRRGPGRVQNLEQEQDPARPGACRPFAPCSQTVAQSDVHDACQLDATLHTCTVHGAPRSDQPRKAFPNAPSVVETRLRDIDPPKRLTLEVRTNARSQGRQRVAPKPERTRPRPHPSQTLLRTLLRTLLKPPAPYKFQVIQPPPPRRTEQASTEQRVSTRPSEPAGERVYGSVG